MILKVDRPPYELPKPSLADMTSGFVPDYAPEEVLEISQKLMKKAQGF